MKIAFYTGTRPGLAGIYNRMVRWWESGPCSHVELVFSDGWCASSSLSDGGVRFKHIEFDPSRWEIIDLGNLFKEDDARQWFVQRVKEGAKYDLLGQLHFLVAPIHGDKDRYWCSEAVAAALGIQDPWRYGPNLLKLVIEEIVSPAPRGVFYSK